MRLKFWRWRFPTAMEEQYETTDPRLIVERMHERLNNMADVVYTQEGKDAIGFRLPHEEDDDG